VDGNPPPLPALPNGARPGDEFNHPKNLKILPKGTSGKDLQHIMHVYTQSLGVRCRFCHVAEEPKAGGLPNIDFASDAKPEKRNARKMILMTADINKKYLHKIEKTFETITCVSCHHGSPKPAVSTDSLAKK
jgi:hypothetical protein